MIKILIGDDHAIVRQGLKQIIFEGKGKCTCGEAENGQVVLDMLDKEDWDVVILDISMPGMSGLDILKEIKKTKPRLPVLVLTMHSEDQFALRSIKAGASGYLTKDSAPEELIKAINKVMDGGKYVNQQLAEILAADIERKAEGPLHDTLSDREYQVMRLIASGRTAKQIADELALSVKTISTYRARLLEKMKMKTNAELTYYAIQNKLVE
ncbi:MAG: response regulator [Bacteroidota bacterium]|jgi:DNA-binding NarL/FixJ family response regulator|nr:response regulator transcription factor [Ignavibacteria bacterium]HEX2867140.1 response regulator transcription factor [Ignavibacteriales bacterium]MCU7497986.1 response regulator transcription factor [Ignavibacteria bacterium]MCU7511728.1 response regulator transcription factor [Ignavibacteria bacterium]MCU7519802.1 response regulator transcription factor [Ignavibacteria bacterium]